MLSGTDHREGMGGWFSVLVCSTCDLGRVEPWPEDPMAWYPDAYQQHSSQTVTGRVVEAAIRAAARSPRPSVRRPIVVVVPDADLGGPLPPGARVLDVGAGNGAAVRALRAAGIDAHGIEPEERAVAAARAAGVTTVSVGTLDDNTLDGRWDVVRMNQVLEHVPEPLDALGRVRELLAPGGRAVISVPNFGSLGRRAFGASWDGLELPRHLHHFTRASLARALAQAGLAARTVRSAALFGVLPASADAATAGGRRQRGWGRSVPVRALLYPLELAVAAGGGGDGLVAVAYARD